MLANEFDHEFVVACLWFSLICQARGGYQLLHPAPGPWPRLRELKPLLWPVADKYRTERRTALEVQDTRYLHDKANPIQLQDAGNTARENLLAGASTSGSAARGMGRRSTM